jgi:hypothetical protein
MKIALSHKLAYHIPKDHLGLMMSKLLISLIFLCALGELQPALGLETQPPFELPSQPQLLAQARSKRVRKLPLPSTRKSRQTVNTKKFTIGAAGLGGLVYSGIGLGVESWYYASSRIHIGANFINVNNEINSKEISGSPIYETFEMKISNVNAVGRYVFWRSFAASGSLGMVFSDGYWGYKDNTNSANNDVTKYKSQLLLASAAIGNHWQDSSGYFIGIDWFGLSLILDKDTKIGDMREGSRQELDNSARFLVNKSAAQQIDHRIAEHVQWYALLFRLGYAF